MTDINSMWLQAGNYEAREDRQVIAALTDAEGIRSGFQVASRALGANMSVDVQPGYAVIQGDDSPNQGRYVVQSDSVVNVAIAAADATSPRIDLVALQVFDPAAGGATGDKAQIVLIQGSPSASPVPPTTPPSTLVIAKVTVGAGVTSIAPGAVDTSGLPQSKIAVWG